MDTYQYAKRACVEKKGLIMDRIIEYFNKISEVDTDGVEPMVQPVFDGANKLRDDVVTNGERREELMKSAPVACGEYYRVPRSI